MLYVANLPLLSIDKCRCQLLSPSNRQTHTTKNQIISLLLNPRLISSSPLIPMVLYLNKIAAPVKSPKTVVILRVILLIILREMSNSKVITLLLKGKGIRDKIGNNISMIILHTTTWLQTVDNHIIIMAVIIY